MVKKLTTEEFIQKAKAIHGDKYDYSAVVYINCEEPVKIYCNHCKKYFEQSPRVHLRGSGCPICGLVKQGQQLKLSQEDFIYKCKQVHGDKYSYDKVVYKGMREKIEIFCKKCNKYFWQGAGKHIRGLDCSHGKSTTLLSREEFIKRAKIVHKDRYDYDKVCYINCNAKVNITCNKCHKQFLQTPTGHLSGKGCPYCQQSKGELVIEEYLREKNIPYIMQYRYKDCKDKYTLPFDFYLPNYNVCIEFQGAQHYKEGIKFFVLKYKNLKKAEEKFRLQKKHDRIKKKYCKNNNINFLEIKHDENIEKKLQEYFDKSDSN